MTTAASGIDQLLADARARLDRLTVTAALDEQRSGALLVDIRPHAQRQADGEVPSALVLERNVLEWRLDPHSDARVPEAAADLRVLVLCAEGYTSSLAAAALRDVGVGRATDVDGGFAAWTAADLPTVPGGTPAGLRSGASPATAPPTTTSTAHAPVARPAPVSRSPGGQRDLVRPVVVRLSTSTPSPPTARARNSAG